VARNPAGQIIELGKQKEEIAQERRADDDGIFSVTRDLESHGEHHGEHQRTWGTSGGQLILAGRSVCALPPAPSETTADGRSLATCGGTSV
jgi:hypothetical protein